MTSQTPSFSDSHHDEVSSGLPAPAHSVPFEPFRASQENRTDISTLETIAPLLRLWPVSASRWRFDWTLLLGIAVATGFFILVRANFAQGPGNPGIDENAYLVAGKNIAQHLTPGMHPDNPYAFVGPMWILTKDGWYYPKYPAGVPLLNAIAIWMGGGHHYGLAYYVSPMCATLAVLAMFFLTRWVAGPFLGFLGALALAANPTLLNLALVPSSHAPAIAFALWGFVALVRWCQTGRAWVGAAAGFLLGYTFTLRYSEGLLLLPLAAAVLTTIRWSNWRSYVHASLPLLAWAVPVLTLVIFNHHTTGHFTGYDSTNESTGFTMAEFKSKWEYTLQELHLYGLFFVFPLGILGMLMMWGRQWRTAMVLTLWFVPSLLLYTAYYWGQNTPGVAYLRFFLTIYPPLIAAAMWVIGAATRGVQENRSQATQAVSHPHFNAFSRWLGLAGATAFVGIIVTLGIYVSLPEMHRQYIENANLAFTTRAFQDAIASRHDEPGGLVRPVSTGNGPVGEPLVFADEGGMFSKLLMHLQFAGEGEWYSVNAFNPAGAGSGGRGVLGMMGGRGRNNNNNDPNQVNPVLVQTERRDLTRKLYDVSQTELTKMERKLISDALLANRPVYAVLGEASARAFEKRLKLQGFEVQVLSTWKEPLKDEDDSGGAANRNGNGPFGRGGLFGGAGGGPPGGGGGRNRGGFGGGNANGLAPPSRMRLTTTPQTLQALSVSIRINQPTTSTTVSNAGG